MGRQSRPRPRLTAIASLALACGLVWPAAAEDAAGTASDAARSAEGGVGEAGASGSANGDDGERLDQLEAKVEVIADELSKAITAATVPEDRELTSFAGLGPAASKVYYRDKGLSIGGYGEVLLNAYVTDERNSAGALVRKNDIFDALRGVLYVGYKFNDRWVVNSEFEFEHAGTSGGGSVSVEFLTLDYMPRDYLSFRVGMVLIPMGFVNEVHEPTFFYGANRPAVERQIIPTTWRENGGGVFGSIGDRVRYRAYMVNGMKATGFSVTGLRGGRQKGSRALSNNWAFVGRVDVDVIDGLVVSGSVYTGKSGQGQINCPPPCTGANPVLVQVPGTPTTLYEVHGEFKRWGLTVQGLLTQAFIGDAGQLNVALGNAPNSGNAVAKTMLGWYLLGAYDVLPLIFPDSKMSLEPYFRYERLDTQNQMPAGYAPNRKYTQDIYTTGLQFKPLPQIVLKLDYQRVTPESHPDDVADAVRFAAGYVF